MAQGVFRGHNISQKLMDWPCPAPHLHTLLFEIQQMDSIVHVNENRTKITTPVNYISAHIDISPWLRLFKHKARMWNGIIMFVMHVFNLLVQTSSAGNSPSCFYWKISHFLGRTPFLNTLSSFCPCLSAIPFITVNVCRGKWKITPGCVCVWGVMLFHCPFVFVYNAIFDAGVLRPFLVLQLHRLTICKYYGCSALFLLPYD